MMESNAIHGTIVGLILTIGIGVVGYWVWQLVKMVVTLIMLMIGG